VRTVTGDRLVTDAITEYPPRTAGPVCPTDHTAYTEYGVFDGTDLVGRVRYRLFEAGYGHYTPTPYRDSRRMPAALSAERIR
jgi:hypothetical protein